MHLNPMERTLPGGPCQPTANARDSVVTRDRYNDFAMRALSVKHRRPPLPSLRSRKVVAGSRGKSASETPLGDRR